MDFDLLLLGKYIPQELREIARLAEELGYDCLWCADEKFFRDAYVGLTYVALNTQRIGFGPGVADPYTRHPAITAMTAATLAEIAPGRFNLGFGAGFSGLHSLGIKQTKPVTTLREAIQLMRQLWSGEQVDFHGEVLDFWDGHLEFTPPEKDIPITMAATGRNMLELAGEVADGIIIGDYASTFTLGRAMEHIRKGAKRSGRPLDDRPIAARVNVILSEDRKAAIDVIRPWIAISLWFTYPKWDYYLDYSPGWEDHFAPLRQFIEQRGAKPRNVGDHELIAPYTHLVTDEMVHDRHIVGSVEEVAEQICSLPSVGVNRVTIYPVPIGSQTEVHVIREFAEEVIPRVRAELPD